MTQPMTPPLPLFGTWLKETATLQQEVYGARYSRFAWVSDNDLAEGTSHRRVQNLVDYVDVMFAATVHELVEMHDETSWKPWQHDDPYVNRDSVVKEIVDALHFLSNVLCAVGCTEAELNQLYTDKMKVNRDRQLRANGYRVKDPGVKCRVCSRALDDVEPSLHDSTICSFCAVKEQINA